MRAVDFVLIQWIAENYKRISDRDRIALLMLISFLLLVAGYAVVWQPLQHSLKQAETHYEEQLLLSKYLRENAGLVEREKSVLPVPAAQLQAVITDHAQSNGLWIEKVDNTRDGSVTVSLKIAPPEKIIDWLVALAERNVAVASASLVRSEDGQVLCTAEFSSP